MTETNDHALAQEAAETDMPRAGAAPTVGEETTGEAIAENPAAATTEDEAAAETPEVGPEAAVEATATTGSVAEEAPRGQTGKGPEPGVQPEPDAEATADIEPATGNGTPDETDAEPESVAQAAADAEVTADIEPATGNGTPDENDAEPESMAQAAADAKVAADIGPPDENDAEPESVAQAAADAKVAADIGPTAENGPPDRTDTAPGPETHAAADMEAAADAEDAIEATAVVEAVDAPETDPAAEAEAAPEVPMVPSAVPFAAALEAGNPVEGKVIGWNKGGFHVACSGVTTFCPRSLMELGNRPRPPARYVNNSYEFHVLEIKEAGRRIVLTRRPAIRSERRRALDEIRARQESREPVSGKVTSVTEFGAFVDLGGGLGGLVHRSQISRTQGGEPTDLVKVGQRIEALVTKVEKKRGKRGGRISLSMKALEPDPWKETAKGLTVGDKFRGKVVRHCEFGLFVEIAPGLDGLVHTSQLPIGKSMSAPEFAVGKEIEGWIVEVAPRRRRLALSLREVPASDPWQDLGEQYAEGAEVEGRVEQVSRHGIFVELEPGLVGLLPMSAITLPDGNQARRAYPPGRDVKVVIESVDRKRRRLGLAPPGARLGGTKSDYKHYRQRQKQSSGLNVMASAFAKLQQPR